MNSIVLALPIALIGVESGWQPLPGGGMEYIIQIEPELVADLHSGRIRLVQSDVHPALRDIRSYRIVVGNDDLPRQLPEQPAAATGTPTSARYSASGSPLAGGAVASFGGVEAPRPVAGQAPALLPSDGASRRLAERPAAHVEPSGGASSAPATTATAPAPAGESSQADRPWGALLATLVALFASLGGNVYLAWIAWESRQRCRRLLAEHGEPDDTGAEKGQAEEDAA